jgi:hypothetical protein
MKRMMAQAFFLILGFFLIIHGFIGSQFAPKNLTSLLTWVHYRGLLVFVIILAGNYFCSVCPMILLRNIGRIFIKPKFDWPRPLRKKWLAAFLFATILFVYEFFDLWGAPASTSILFLAIFTLSLSVDLIFKKAAFCKYLCPIGQFNFLSSTISPKEVAVVDQKICDSCTTYECLNGNPSKKWSQGKLGCELDLFLPQKVGNIDCTFCFECVHACPSFNVKLVSRIPGEELVNEKHRAGVGKIGERVDLSYLILVFVFGALLNALGMVGPVYEFHRMVMSSLQLETDLFSLILLFIFFLVFLPWLCLVTVPRRLIPLLLPLGIGIWTAHYCFHFMIGIFTFIPIIQDLLHIPGQFPVRWMGLPLSMVYPVEIGILLLGATLSLGLHKKLQERSLSKSLLTWQVLILISAIWLLSLPMEMRGTV